MQIKSSCPITTLFAVNKDEWDTKEDTGKSMKNTLASNTRAAIAMAR